MATTRELHDRVVAVVGATGGLGSAICDALESRGAVVVAANRSGSTDRRHVDITADIRSARACGELIDSAIAAHGRLDGVIVAAGIVAFGDVDEMDDVAVEELFLTNSMAPIWIAKRAAAALSETQGFFVNISGVVATTPMPGMSAYSASKAAAAAASASIRREWRRSKILVVDAQPPHTETGLATRPIAGAAPSMPQGLAAETVAERIVTAIESGDTDLSADSFG